MRIFIVDSSYLIYRSFFAFPRLMTNDGLPVGAYYGFVKTILSVLKKYKPDQLVFTNDMPIPTWRHIEFENYKAGRPKPDPEMISQIEPIQKWCKLISSNYFVSPGFEADDIIYSVVNQLVQHGYSEQNTNEKNFIVDHTDFEYTKQAKIIKIEQTEPEIIILSSDRDLYQILVYPQVKFVGLRQEKNNENTLFGQTEFRQKYLLEPIQWLDYKALVGDNSDNLDGVPGIGAKIATHILQMVGSLYEYYKAVGLDPKPFLSSRYVNEHPQERSKKSSSLELFLHDGVQSGMVQKLNTHYEQIAKIYRLSRLSLVPDLEIKYNDLELLNGVSMLYDSGMTSLVKATYEQVGEPPRGQMLL